MALFGDQLSLAIHLSDGACFANFYPGRNQALLAALQQLVVGEGANPLFIWGANSSGRSHLLYALCDELQGKGLKVAYLPLLQLRSVDVAVLDGLEHNDLLCIDDVDAVAANPIWERGLFELYNRWRYSDAFARCRVVISAANSPNHCGFVLPDLISRLQWGAVYQLHELDDSEKLAALQLRAALRGMRLSLEVARFLLTHLPRDMDSLIKALDQLDKASIKEQRLLTLPFVKTVLKL